MHSSPTSADGSPRSPGRIGPRAPRVRPCSVTRMRSHRPMRTTFESCSRSTSAASSSRRRFIGGGIQLGDAHGDRSARRRARGRARRGEPPRGWGRLGENADVWVGTAGANSPLDSGAKRHSGAACEPSDRPIVCSSHSPFSSRRADHRPRPLGPSTSATPELDESVAELIAAAETSLATGTVRVAQTIEFEGSSIIPDDTSAWAQGQATLDQPRRMHLTADFSALQLGKLEMFVDDSLVYMHGPVFDQLAGEGKWLLVDLESSDPAAAPFKSLASGQNDVGMALAYLYGATEPVVATASNPIDGQIMRHLETEIDLELARERIPADQSEALEDLIASMRVAGIERKLDAEVWIGGVDGLVHRTGVHLRPGRRPRVAARRARRSTSATSVASWSSTCPRTPRWSRSRTRHVRPGGAAIRVGLYARGRMSQDLAEGGELHRIGHPRDDPPGAGARRGQPRPGLPRLRLPARAEGGGQGGDRRRHQPVRDHLGRARLPRGDRGQDDALLPRLDGRPGDRGSPSPAAPPRG